MNRYLLAIIAALALCAAPQLVAVDSAKPAAMAADYATAPPVPGAPPAPAVKAGLDQAGATSAAAEPWYKGAGGIAVGIAASLVLSLLGVARHSATIVPQPWGSILSLLANGAYAVLAPKVEQIRDKNLEHHEDTVFTMVELIEKLGNTATIADLKAKLGDKLPSGARDVLNATIDEVKRDLATKKAA